MPRLSQWIIRTALLYLLLGFTFGALLLWHKGVPLHPALWRWLPAHVEFLLIGWIAQLTMGVAFWILPRYWQKERRGKEGLVWLAFGLLNLGIWLVVAYATFQSDRLFLLAGRGAEIGAAVCFAIHAGSRTLSREEA